MPQHHPTHPQSLPDPLKEDLQRLYTQDPGLDEAFDRRVLEPCTLALADAQAVPKPALGWAPWAAAAVLMAMFGAGWMLSMKPNPLDQSSDLALAQIEDLDRNGRIDILDAFALARQLENGPPPTQPDLNGDGRVDAIDLEVLASRAVRLKGDG